MIFPHTINKQTPYSPKNGDMSAPIGKSVEKMRTNVDNVAASAVPSVYYVFIIFIQKKISCCFH